MASRIIFHMVYASRGDAIILEVFMPDNTDRFLVIVDGGPIHNGPKTRGADPTAPYYRYLMAVAQHVWGLNSSKPKIKLMINTHNDNDHYGGLLELIRKRHAGQDDLFNFEFTGPFLSPYYKSGSFTHIEKALGAARFYGNNLPLTRNLFGEVLMADGTIKVHFPGHDQIVQFVYCQPGHAPPLLSNLTPIPTTTAHDKNDSSILTTTRFSNLTQGTFLTGDARAQRIQQEFPATLLGAHMYKLEHHGGMTGQHDDWYPGGDGNCAFTKPFLHEFLLMNLAIIEDPDVTEIHVLDHDSDLERLRLVANYFKTVIVNNNTNYTTLRSRLREQRETHVRNALDWKVHRQAVGGTLPPALACVDLVVYNNITVSDLYTRLRAALKNPDALTGRTPYETWLMNNPNVVHTAVKGLLPYTGVGAGRRKVKWFRNYCRLNTQWLMGELWTIIQIRKHYARFRVDTYTVSGTVRGNSQHPTYEVLWGLALACRYPDATNPNAPGRAATLYVTDPSNLYHSQLVKIGKRWNLGLNEFFAGQYLTIRYLENGMFFSLNTQPGQPNYEVGAHTGALGALQNAPQQLVLRNSLSDNNNVLQYQNAARYGVKLQEMMMEVVQDNNQQSQPTGHFIHVRLDNNQQNPRLTVENGEWAVYGRPSNPTLLGNVSVRPVDAGNNEALTNAFTFALLYHRTDIDGVLLWKVVNRADGRQLYYNGLGQVTFLFLGNEELIIKIKIVEPGTVEALHQFHGTHAIVAAPVIQLDPSRAAVIYRVDNEEEEATEEATEDLAEDLAGISLEYPAGAAVEEGPDDVMEAAPEETREDSDLVTTTDTHPETPDFSETPSTVIGTLLPPQEAASDLQIHSISSGLETMTGGHMPDSSAALEKVFSSLLRYKTKLANHFPPGLMELAKLIKIDMASSTVTVPPPSQKRMLSSQARGYGFETCKLVTSADIPTPLQLQLGDQQLQIPAPNCGIKLVLNGLDLTVEVSLNTDEVSMDLRRKTTLASTLSSLRDYLVSQGLKPEHILKTSLLASLVLICGDAERVLDRLTQAVPQVILETGFAYLLPDLDNSPVTWRETPFGEHEIQTATVLCQLNAGTIDGEKYKFSPQMDFGCVKVALDSLSVEVGEITTIDHISSRNGETTTSDLFVQAQPDRDITLVAHASIGFETSKAVQLTLRYNIKPIWTELEFEAAYISSLADLVANFDSSTQSALPEFEKLPVPLTKSTSQNPQPNVNAGAVAGACLADLKHTKFGFTLKEVNWGTNKFDLSRIFVQVDCNDWLDYLPGTLKSNAIRDIQARVIVRDPTKETHRVETDITFKVDLPPDKLQLQDQFIQARFSSISLTPTSNYYFNVGLTCPQGFGIEDLARVMNWGANDSFGPDVPVLSDLAKLKVTNVALGVAFANESRSGETPSGIKVSVTDWSLALRVDRITLITEKFVLEKLDLELSGGTGPGVYAEGCGYFSLPAREKELQVGFGLPQRISPGYLHCEAPEGLNLADVLSLIDVPVPLTGVPFVETMVDVELMSFHLDVGYKMEQDEENPVEPTEQNMCILGAMAAFRHEGFTLGKLEFSNVLFSFAWERHGVSAVTEKPDPTTPSTQKSSLHWVAQASLPSRTLNAKLTYRSETKSLTAELIPLRPALVGELLTTVLPSDLISGILPIVGDLRLHEANVIFSFEEDVITELNLCLLESESMSFQTIDGAHAPLVISGIHVHYRRAKPTEIVENRLAESGKNGQLLDQPDKDDPSGSDLVGNMFKDTSRDTLVIIGEVKLNDLRAKIEFMYASAVAESKLEQGPSEKPSNTTKLAKTPKITKGQIAIRVSAVDTSALTLQNLMDLFEMQDVKYEKPEDCPGFLTFGLDYAVGIVSFAPSGGEAGSSSRGFKLEQLEVVVQNHKKFTIFETSPPLELERLWLKIMYSVSTEASPRGKPDPDTGENTHVPAGDKSDASSRTYSIEAAVYGTMTISDYRLTVAFRHTKKYGTAFAGKLSKGEELPADQNKLDIAHIADKFLAPAPTNRKSKFEFPSDIKLPKDKLVGSVYFVFKPGEFLEAVAFGENVWSGDFGGDLKFDVKKLGAYIRITKSALLPDDTKRKFEYEIYLHGEMTINDFTSARATLGISPGRGATLRASIMRDISGSSAEGGEIGSFADPLSKTNQTSNWSTLVKSTSPNPFAVEGSAVLFIDFKAPRFVLLGKIKDIGYAVLSSRKLVETPDKYGVYFSLNAENVHNLWTSQKTTVSNVWKIRRVAMQVVTYETSVQGLIDNLKTSKDNGKQQKMLDMGTPDGPEAPAEPKETPQDHQDVTILSKLKPEEKIVPGAWFFAEITVPSPGDATSSESILESSLACAVSDMNTLSDLPSPTETKMLLFACVSNMSAQSESRYSVRIENLKLLGGFMTVVNGTGTYYPGDEAISNNTRRLEVAALLKFGGLQRDTLDFEIDLHVNHSETWFKARAGGPVLEKPFEEMFNVKLVDLEVAGAFRKDKAAGNYLTVTGKVQLGRDIFSPAGSSEREPHLTGMILFHDMIPRGVLLQYDTGATGGLSVRDFHKKLLVTGPEDLESSSVGWPEEYPDFRFESAMIYYVSSTTSSAMPTHDTIPYKQTHLWPGYHLSATVYLFDKPFELGVNIGDAKTAGISFSAVYKGVIDLDIVELSGYKSTKTPEQYDGPAIVVRTKSDSRGVSFEVKAGVSLFGCAPLSASLEYKTEPTRFHGTIEVPADFLGLGGEAHEIAFEYKNSRFRLDGLKVANAFSDIAKVEELLEEGSKILKQKGCVCEPLVKLAFEKTIVGKFKFGIRLPEEGELKEGVKVPEIREADVGAVAGAEAVAGTGTVAALDTKVETESGSDADPNTNRDILGGKHRSILNKDGDLELKFTWQYDIMTEIGSVFLFSVHFKDWPLRIRPKVGKNGLLAAIKAIVLDNIGLVAEELVKDPSNLAILAGVLALDQLAPELIASFLCRGTKNRDLTKQGNKQVNKSIDESWDLLKIAEKLVGVVGGVVAVVLAAEGVVTIVGAALAIGEGLLIGLAAVAAALIILEACRRLKNLVAENSTTTPEEKEEIEKRFAEAEEKLRAAEKALNEHKAKFEEMMVVDLQPATFTAEVDEPQKRQLKLDFSKALPMVLMDPNGQLTTEGNVTWTVEMSHDKSFTNPVNPVTKAVTGTSIAVLEDAATWPYERTFFARVKASLQVAKADEKGVMHETVYMASSWSTVAKLTLTPYLRPPTLVELEVETANDTARVEVTGHSEWLRVQVCGGPSPNMEEMVYWDVRHNTKDVVHEAFSCSGHLADPANGFSADTAMARAKNVSLSDEYQDSEYVYSPALPIGGRVSDVRADMKNSRLWTTWTIPSSEGDAGPQDDVTVYGILPSGMWVKAEAVEADPDSGRGIEHSRSAFFTLPSVHVAHGDIINAAVCQTRAVSTKERPRLKLFSKSSNKLEVDYVPLLTINEDKEKTFLDLESGKLTVSFTSAIERPKDSHVFLRVRRDTGKVKELECSGDSSGSVTRIVDTDVRAGIVETTAVKIPVVANIELVIQDSRFQKTKTSAPWKLTMSQSSLPMPTLAVWGSGAGVPPSLAVSWTKVASVSSISLSARPAASTSPTSWLEVPIDVATPTTSTNLLTDSTWPTSPGSEFVISVRFNRKSVRGKPATIHYTVPAPPSAPIFVSETTNPIFADPVSPDSSLSFSSVSSVLWANTAGTVTGVYVRVSGPAGELGKTSQIVSIEAPGSSSREGIPSAHPASSGVAHVSLHPSHEEIFWIDSMGSIQSRRCVSVASGTVALKFTRTSDFPFSVDGTAIVSSKLEGQTHAVIPITAVVRANKIYLVWVDGKGRLVGSMYSAPPWLIAGSEPPEDEDGGEWSDVIVIAKGDSAPNPTSPLSTVTRASEIIWFSRAGAVCYFKPGKTGIKGTLGTVWDGGDETDAGTQPVKGLAAISTPQSGSRVFWADRSGSIMTAARIQDSDDWDVGLAAGPGTAATESDLAATLGNDNTVQLWAIDSNGAMLVVKPQLKDGAISFWHSGEILSPNTAILNGRALLAAAVATNDQNEDAGTIVLYSKDAQKISSCIVSTK
ncbi:hypothetical protein ACJQWK_02154 [Exserohilum turcicum]